MKKQILALTLGLLSLGVMAQKKELKAAQKAIKKNNFTAAVSAIKNAEALISNMDAKSKAKFYFLKGQAFAGTNDLKTAADAYSSLMSFEKSTGKNKYSKQAAPLLNTLKNDVQKKAFDLYKSKDLKGSSEAFYLRYLLEKKDTMFLSNAAQISLENNNLEKAFDYYNTLKDLGYTGIEKQFLATNVASNEVENLGTKKNRDLMIKLKKYIKPEDKITKSKKATIIKNLAVILNKQGKNEEALKAYEEARKIDPNDLQLLLGKAFLHNDLKQMDKFEALMREAVQKDPNNPDLFYNIGVVNYNEKRREEAVKYFKKVIELKPDYKGGNLMMANALLIKDSKLVEQMNALPPSDMNGYTKLENERKALYKEILPFLVKADSQERSIDTVKLLMNIYESLENEAKASEYRALWKEMR